MSEVKRDGKTPDTAFILKDNSGEMTASVGEILNGLFGGDDGNYFVYSETTLDNKKNGKRYKILFVEDNAGVKHQIYFEMP